MRRGLFTLIVTLFLVSCSEPDIARMLESYQWKNRLLIVLSPSFDDARFTAQQRALANYRNDAEERELVVFHISDRDGVGIDGELKPHLFAAPFYRHLQADPGEFSVILIGKDGGEKLRQHAPVTAEQLNGIIDAMPMRQKESEMKNVQ